MTKEQTNWEDEFDKLTPNYIEGNYDDVVAYLKDNNTLLMMVVEGWDICLDKQKAKQFISKTISQEREKMIEEIKKVYVGYYGRTEGRDDSYDDAFLDGTEVMQKKILDLLQNK